MLVKNITGTAGTARKIRVMTHRGPGVNRLEACMNGQRSPKVSGVAKVGANKFFRQSSFAVLALYRRGLAVPAVIGAQADDEYQT